MTKRMLIDALHPEETRVAIADDNQIYDFDFVSTAKKQLKGNIYLAKITRVEPSLQAAFVEYGGGKQGFLPFSEIHADYYQIPVSDRKRLMEEEARQSEAEEAEEAARPEPGSEPQSYGQQPLLEPAPGAENPFLSEMPELASLPDAEEGAAHPAYLMQGAIDLFTASDEVSEPGANLPLSEIITPYDDFSAPKQEDPASPLGDAEIETSRDETLSRGEALAKAEGVETLPNEEEEYRPKKHVFFKRYKIQEVIRRGQIVLVQVIKEERGNKGVSLTTYLSLAGRYCVLMPNSPKDGGISRKIASGEDRKRLKAISTELRLADGMSVIIRTAGMDRTRAEIKRDYDYLVKVWNQIREDTLKSNAPALIYEESDIIKRAIRDQYSNDIDELIVEGDEGYRSAKEFMKLLMASHTPKIKHYKEATPLFYAYNIEEQLLSMHDPVVKLRSGGYIVINPTEALISIDVNSGRATGERNIEETATKTNLEAAAEVARQLRLRDLAGLIVIDFIDMLESRNRRAVEKSLKDALKADRAKIQLGRISPFGLLEMSRQRLRPSISETNMVQCPHCIGRGIIRSNESMSIQMIRTIEKEASAGAWSGLRLMVPQTVALHLLNHKRDILRAIEQRYGLTIQVLIGADLTASEFNLEKIRRSGERGETPERERRPRRERPERAERHDRRPQESASVPEEAGNDNAEPAEEAPRDMREENFGAEGERKGRGRRRRGRGRDRDRPQRGERAPMAPGEAPPLSGTGNGQGTENFDAPAAAIPTETSSANPRRERGGRGRRPWRNRDERAPHETPAGEESSAPLPANFSSEPSVAAAYRPEPSSPPPAPAQVIPLASTPRDPGAPAKKGWWKKMIDLDN